MTDNSRFDALIRDFLESRNMPSDSAAYGLEFESEGVTVQVVAHPRLADRLIVDAVVAALEPESDARLLQLLLEFNNGARFEHEWQAAINSDAQLIVHTWAPLERLTLAGLEELMIEGVDQALAVRALVQISEAAAPAEPDTGVAAGMGATPGFIRG
jgi:hypothetical protein